MKFVRKLSVVTYIFEPYEVCKKTKCSEIKVVEPYEVCKKTKCSEIKVVE
jgi:hypothetical protein